MSTDLQTSAQPLWFIDNLAYVHVAGEQSGGAFSLCEISAAHGSMPPPHVHHRDDETFYVLEGELRLFLGDRQIVVRAGRAALAPRDVPHTYSVESDLARYIVINSPAGFEQFLRDASEPAPSAELPPPGRPLDPGRIGPGRGGARDRDPRPSRDAARGGVSDAHARPALAAATRRLRHPAPTA